MSCFADATKDTCRNTPLLAHSSPTVHGYSDESKPEILPTPRSEGDILSSPHLKAFTLNDLKNATKNFGPENLIGQGGFGYVYKGWIDDQSLEAARPGSGMIVAVKKLKPEGFQGHKEWLVGCSHCHLILPILIKMNQILIIYSFLFLQSELNYLGQLHHPNLVKLIGFCLDGDNRLLVYEYMPKGSLENHLFRSMLTPLVAFSFRE